LQTIDFAWPSAHLNAVALYLFGLPLLLVVTAVWFMDSYAMQLATTSEMSLGRFTMASIPVIVLTASMGMVLGGRLARKKSRSLIQTLKEAIAIPTISTSERASSEKSL
jgi:prolipoprotein diacylglyceryltransferase